MSRTNLNAADLAESLRSMAGDGDMEWVYEPIRSNVLLDIADLLEEDAKLRELVKLAYDCATSGVCCRDCDLVFGENSCQLKSELEKLGIGV